MTDSNRPTTVILLNDNLHKNWFVFSVALRHVTSNPSELAVRDNTNQNEIELLHFIAVSAEPLNLCTNTETKPS